MNAQAVHGWIPVELAKWEPTLHGPPWRRIKGAAPCAVKVARTVLNGGDEETYRKATRLVPTQREPHFGMFDGVRLEKFWFDISCRMMPFLGLARAGMPD